MMASITISWFYVLIFSYFFFYRLALRHIFRMTWRQCKNCIWIVSGSVAISIRENSYLLSLNVFLFSWCAYAQFIWYLLLLNKALAENILHIYYYNVGKVAQDNLVVFVVVVIVLLLLFMYSCRFYCMVGYYCVLYICVAAQNGYDCVHLPNKLNVKPNDVWLVDTNFQNL